MSAKVTRLPKLHVVTPNVDEDIVKALETALEEAKRGEIQHVVIAKVRDSMGDSASTVVIGKRLLMVGLLERAKLSILLDGLDG